MYHGKMEQDWTHTSQLIAMQANAFRDTKKHGTVSPLEVNQYYQMFQKKDREPQKADITVLKHMATNV